MRSLDRYHDEVLRYVRRRIRDPHLAEDIAQETLLRAFRAAAAIDTDRPLWPWLQAIVQNLIANRMRYERRVRRHLVASVDIGELESTVDPRPDGDPEAWLSKLHDREAISHSLNQLSPRQRRVLLMRVAEGLSYEQIARAEGVSLDASKSLVKRARRSFRVAHQSRAMDTSSEGQLRSGPCRMPGDLDSA